MQALAAGAPQDHIGKGVGSQRTGADDHIPCGEIGDLLLDDLNVGVSPDMLGHRRGKALPIHSQGSPGSHPMAVGAQHDQAAQPPQLFFQEPHGVGQLVAAQGVGADQLRKIGRDVRRRHFLGLHLCQPDGDPPDGQLPGRFRARQSGSHHCHRVHFFAFGFFTVFAAVSSPPGLRR